MNVMTLVLRWCDFYTRDLDPAIATGRRDELRSDLWEHARWSEGKSGGAILWRAIRGVPADLAWRHEQRVAAARLVPMGRRVLGAGVATLSVGAASLLIALGVVTLARRAWAVGNSFVPAWSTNAAWILALTVLATVGALLLIRRRTRSLGAGALALSTALIHFALYELSNKSDTLVALTQTPLWNVAIGCSALCLVCVFLSEALLSLPTRKATR